ncbi:hypothetical protein N7448_008980 [Penicillium atrosanguineum]|nr:hypothetical protein N7448_008980 [Penicillium atrosanguineum]
MPMFMYFMIVLSWKKSLTWGVTTVLDMHNEPDYFQRMKKIADERNDVSDIKSACHAATITNGWPSPIVRLTSKNPEIETRISQWPNITDEKSVDQYIAKSVADGASFIKLMQEAGDAFNLPFPTRPIPTPTSDIQKAIVSAAHRHNMLAVGHAMTTSATLQNLRAGVDGSTHASLEPMTAEILQEFERTNAFLIPTLAVHTSSTGEEQVTRDQFASGLEGADKDHMLASLSIVRQGATMENAYEMVKSLKQAGIDILCGTDTSHEMVGQHQECLSIKNCGFMSTDVA